MASVMIANAIEREVSFSQENGPSAFNRLAQLGFFRTRPTEEHIQIDGGGWFCKVNIGDPKGGKIATGVGEEKKKQAARRVAFTSALRLIAQRHRQIILDSRASKTPSDVAPSENTTTPPSSALDSPPSETVASSENAITTTLSSAPDPLSIMREVARRTVSKTNTLFIALDIEKHEHSDEILSVSFSFVAPHWRKKGLMLRKKFVVKEHIHMRSDRAANPRPDQVETCFVSLENLGRYIKKVLGILERADNGVLLGHMIDNASMERLGIGSDLTFIGVQEVEMALSGSARRWTLGELVSRHGVREIGDYGPGDPASLIALIFLAQIARDGHWTLDASKMELHSFRMKAQART